MGKRLRISGGVLRGRMLHGPQTMVTRPTSARVREALFNILQDRVVGARVADCFAGSGALGLEALSRGAKHTVFFESHRSALETIERNIMELDLQSTTTIRRGKLPASLSAAEPFDLVFIDPPWDKGWAQRILQELIHFELLRDGAMVVLEERRGNLGPTDLAQNLWELESQRTYGDTELTLLTRR